MSKLTSGVLSWYPPAANGVTLTPSGTAWANSAWVEVVASTSAAVVVAQAVINPANISVWFEIDVGIGAAGAEVVIGTLKGYRRGSNNTSALETALAFGLGLDSVPTATRIAVRMRKTGTDTTTWSAAIGYITQSAVGTWTEFTDELQEVLPSAADGVAITSSASAWANGAYAALTTGLARSISIVGISIESGSSNIRGEIDLATGGAGSEVVVTTIPLYTSGARAITHIVFPTPLYIPGDTRIAVRARDASGTSVAMGVAIEYFGDLLGERPVGNGENPGGTNPTAGTLPTTFPLKFVQIRTHDGTSRYYGETLLSDNASWTAAPGKKPAKLVGVSKIRRALSNRGAFITTRFTVTLADTDRQFRALAESQMLRGAYLAVYVIDDATRRAEGTPIRLMAGIVTSHRALPGFRYELEAEDVLGHKLSEYSKQPTLPPDKFSLADFPGLDPALEGRTIPIAMGALVDDASEPTPQGVVPALFVGYANLNTIGGVDAVCDCYIFTQCAAAGVWDMYFNPPVWSASKPATDTGAAEPVVVEVGDVVRPTPDNASGFIYRATVGGTVGATEPVWPTGVSSTVADGGATWQRSDADTPNYRLLVPDAAYGTVLVTPGKPGWTAATSQTTDYLDYNGRRYTPLFILRSHRYAKAVREGRIVVTANLYGVTETSDGSGRYFDDPPRMWEWLLINYVFGRYTTGAYLTPPTLDGTYAAIDHTSVEAAVTAHDARYLPTGYVGAVLLGADGSQSTVFDELQKLCEGGDFDQGINRHGQLMLSVETVTASPVLTFDSQSDIEDGSYETWIESSDYANEQEHLWGRRYIQTSVVATPKPGDPLPRTEQKYGEWQSGLTRQEDSVAIANAGERVKYTLQNYVVRDDNVAESVGETLFLRNLGALREGPRMVRFTTGWQGLGTGATHLDLGSVIGLTHPERVGTSATATDTCRILAIEVDPLRDRVTLECRVLATIADASLLQQWAPVTLTDVGTESDGTTTDGVSGQDLA